MIVHQPVWFVFRSIATKQTKLTFLSLINISFHRIESKWHKLLVVFFFKFSYIDWRELLVYIYRFIAKAMQIQQQSKFYASGLSNHPTLTRWPGFFPFDWLSSLNLT